MKKFSKEELRITALDIAIEMLLPHTPYKTKEECEEYILSVAIKRHADLQKNEKRKVSVERRQRAKDVAENRKKMQGFDFKQLEELFPKIKKLAIKKYKINPDYKYCYLDEAILNGFWDITISSDSNFYIKKWKDVTVELCYSTTRGVYEDDDVHFYAYFTLEELGFTI